MVQKAAFYSTFMPRASIQIATAKTTMITATVTTTMVVSTAGLALIELNSRLR
jgi:hypothetical protein